MTTKRATTEKGGKRFIIPVANELKEQSRIFLMDPELLELIEDVQKYYEMLKWAAADYEEEKACIVSICMYKK